MLSVIETFSIFVSLSALIDLNKSSILSEIFGKFGPAGEFWEMLELAELSEPVLESVKIVGESVLSLAEADSTGSLSIFS